MFWMRKTNVFYKTFLLRTQNVCLIEIPDNNHLGGGGVYVMSTSL